MSGGNGTIESECNTAVPGRGKARVSRQETDGEFLLKRGVMNGKAQSIREFLSYCSRKRLYDAGSA